MSRAAAARSGEYLRAWHRYVRQSAFEQAPPSLRGFLTYMEQSWEAANAWQLIGRVFKKTGQVLRYGVSHPSGAGEPPLERVRGEPEAP